MVVFRSGSRLARTIRMVKNGVRSGAHGTPDDDPTESCGLAGGVLRVFAQLWFGVEPSRAGARDRVRLLGRSCHVQIDFAAIIPLYTAF